MGKDKHRRHHPYHGGGGGGGQDVQGFKRMLQGEQQQQQQQQQQLGDGHHNNPAGGQQERRRISFHLARKPQNGFVSLSTTKSGGGAGGGGNKDKRGLQQAAHPQQDTPDDHGLPAADKGIYPESKIRQLVTWKGVGATGPGLYNLGNTCFLNATLQCLAYLPPLAQFFLAEGKALGTGGDEGKEPSGRFPVAGGGARDWLSLLRDLIVNMHTGGGAGGGPSTHSHHHHHHHHHHGEHGGGGGRRQAISPKAIVSSLKALNKHFRVGRQEDAHEFLRHLIDALQNNCLKAARVKSNAPHRVAETTFVHRIFGGYLRSQVRCTSCGYCSNTYDSFLDLSLEIHGKVGSLQEALARFTSVETLDKANRWKCTGCAQLVCAKKQLTLHVAPNVCTVQLKRFMFGSRSSKIGKAITYPEALRIPVSGPERVAEYRLTGVLVHAGASVNMGHYYSYVKAANGMWYEMDDARVSTVGMPTVMKQNAYLLFYVKVLRTIPVPKALPPAGAAALPAKQADWTKTEKKKKEEEAKQPSTPGWSEVLAKLREEDAKAVDHSKDLQPDAAMVDTSWTQPKDLAAFMQERLGGGGGGGKSRITSAKREEEKDEDVGVKAPPSSHKEELKKEEEESSSAAMSGSSIDSFAPVSDEDNDDDDDEASESSASSERSFLPALDLGKVVWAYCYAGKFVRTRYSRQRWQRMFSPWARDKRQEGDLFLGERLLAAAGGASEAEEEKRATEPAEVQTTVRSKKATAKEEEEGTAGKRDAKGAPKDTKHPPPTNVQQPPPPQHAPAEAPHAREPHKKKQRKGGERVEVVRRDEEGIVLVPRSARGGKPDAAASDGATKGFDIRTVKAIKHASLGDLVGQWGDDEEEEEEGGDALAFATAVVSQARKEAEAKAKAEERQEKAKRQLSEHAAAAVAGKKKKVKGPRDAEEDGGLGIGGDKPNPFEARQQEQRQAKAGRGGGRGGGGRGNLGGGGGGRGRGGKGGGGGRGAGARR